MSRQIEERYQFLHRVLRDAGGQKLDRRCHATRRRFGSNPKVFIAPVNDCLFFR